MNRISQHPNAPALGTTLDDRYTLERLIGLGGLGAVYEAVTPRDERVAIKVLLALTDTREAPGILARLERDAEVTGAISSPYVVPVLGSGSHGGAPYLVMPLLDGLDVASLLERTGALHPTVAVRIMCHVCRALAASHAAGVIHRDVKPANIFLHHDSGAGSDVSVTARVLDFGLAKPLRGSSITESGSFVGTPRYMAPEQVLDAKRADERADVWSVGATLYAMLAGVPLFSEVRSLTQLILELTTGFIEPLQERAPWIDLALAHVVDGCLLRDVDARCPSPDALLDALLPFCGESEKLTAAMLDRVPDAITEHAAKRGELTTCWDGGGEPTVSVPLPLGEQSRDPLLGQTLGRFEIIQRLGRGGMGSVYEARSQQGERVAIKVMAEGVSERHPRALRRFVREARAAMQIDSDYVVRVFEVDEQDGQPFIVMELLEGIDLSRMLTRRGALAPGPVVRLFVQACHGLAAAHELGVVHRDIKPSNMFLHHLPTGEMRLKICDFGIAKQLAGDGATASITQTGGVIGSPQYMSPEQTKDAKNVDLKSDVWSLCVSLYEALSGGTPWEGRATVGELIVAICTECPPHLQDKAPWIDPSLVEAVHRGLHQEAGKRHESMDALRALLEPHADAVVTTGNLLGVSPRVRANEAVRAVQPSTATLTQASVARASPVAPKRSPGGLAAIGALAVAAVAVGLWQLREKPRDDLTIEPLTAVAPPRPQPSTYTARVAIEPPTAEIVVDGEPTSLREGVLELEGEPGDSFVVVARAGDSEERHTVVIRKDGRAAPRRISVVVGAPKLAPATPNWPPPGPRAGSAISAAGGASPPPPISAPATSARAKTKTTPKYDEDWR